MDECVFHGTSKEKADRICKQKSFGVSNGTEEWLGRGIYFYYDYLEADEWAQKIHHEDGCVLMSQIKGDGCIDLDTSYGKEIFETTKRVYSDKFTKIEMTIQGNQCAVCNAIWDGHPEVTALIGIFAKEPTTGIRTLTDTRRRRKECCIRDNSLVKRVAKIWWEEGEWCK